MDLLYLFICRRSPQIMIFSYLLLLLFYCYYVPNFGNIFLITLGGIYYIYIYIYICVCVFMYVCMYIRHVTVSHFHTAIIGKSFITVYSTITILKKVAVLT